MYRQGLLVVVSGPSGSGKGTVVDLLMQTVDNLSLSISATTRKPRMNEQEGINYYFKSDTEFQQMIAQDELAEWVKYCGHYYGTPKKNINDSLKKGLDVILEIEVEGALKVKEQYPDSILVFLLPPDFEELESRIKKRGTEDELTIATRMEKARRELLLAEKYDYIVFNDQLDETVSNIKAVIMAEKLKYKRTSTQLAQFIEKSREDDNR